MRFVRVFTAIVAMMLGTIVLAAENTRGFVRSDNGSAAPMPRLHIDIPVASVQHPSDGDPPDVWVDVVAVPIHSIQDGIDAVAAGGTVHTHLLNTLGFLLSGKM